MSTTPTKHDKISIFRPIIQVFLFICFSIGANAQELDRNIIQILKQLGLEEDSVHVPMTTQRVLPYAKNKSVIVISTKEKLSPDNFKLGAYIVITEKGKIINKFYEQNAWDYCDFVACSSSITIDTTPYILNSDTRAFGVRVDHSFGGSANFYNVTAISLFVPHERTLTRVLRDYPVFESDGEVDSYCAGEFKSSEALINIDKEQTNDFANLVISNKRTWTVSQVIGNNEKECESKDASMTLSKTLKFDGQEYKYKYK